MQSKNYTTPNSWEGESRFMKTNLAAVTMVVDMGAGQGLVQEIIPTHAHVPVTVFQHQDHVLDHQSLGTTRHRDLEVYQVHQEGASLKDLARDLVLDQKTALFQASVNRDRVLGLSNVLARPHPGLAARPVRHLDANH